MEDLNFLYLSSLVRKAQVGDSDAFAEIYALTYKKQYNFACHYLRDEYLAQDVVQDVYIHALKHLGEIKETGLFVAWLNQITFHMCFDLCKKKDRNYGEINPLALELSEDSYIDHNPEEVTENRDEIRRVQQAVNALPPPEQRAIVMRFYNDMQIEEIAKATGVSRSTVKRQLLSGRDMLQKMLE